MTEAEWIACVEPSRMLELPCGRASDRKYRLFAAACCRRIWHLIADPECRKAVEVAEAYADGLITSNKLERADTAVTAKVMTERLAAWSTHDGYVRYMAAGATHCAVKRAYLSHFAASAARYASRARSAAEGAEESAAQAQLIRDILGNPFRSVADAAGWRTVEATSLARAIYDERAFDRLHELADTLKWTGCEEEELSAHCYETGPHVRGCWAIDTILGRS